jgi:23S rRNA (adenine1618-N6)-methyltransferase
MNNNDKWIPPKPDASPFHENNPHTSKYDMKTLMKADPALESYVFKNKYDTLTIDFADDKAVYHLNNALLSHHYGIKDWTIPEGYLCPPIPGRVDYLYQLNDLLSYIDQSIERNILDIGTGANCIYPLLGASKFGWTFVGSDIDPLAIANAENIVKANPQLPSIIVRHQPDQTKIFQSIILEDEKFDACICNPPFNQSAEEARQSNLRKVKNLHNKREEARNFGGTSGELWCEDGEVGFISRMIDESVAHRDKVKLFTTLVSKEKNIAFYERKLALFSVKKVSTIPMSTSNKKSRILAWQF